MGTHSSDFRSIASKSYRIKNPSPTTQGTNTERELTDGGGEGFMLFLLALVLSALAVWLT